MNWISIKDKNKIFEELPKDKEFFSIFKGRFILMQYDKQENRFYVSMPPADYELSFPFDEECLKRITHYCLPHIAEV